MKGIKISSELEAKKYIIQNSPFCIDKDLKDCSIILVENRMKYRPEVVKEPTPYDNLIEEVLRPWSAQDLCDFRNKMYRKHAYLKYTCYSVIEAKYYIIDHFKSLTYEHRAYLKEAVKESFYQNIIKENDYSDRPYEEEAPKAYVIIKNRLGGKKIY